MIDSGERTWGVYSPTCPEDKRAYPVRPDAAMKPYPGGRRGGLHVLPLGTLCVVAALVPLAVGSVHQILWGRCYAHCLENHLATESPEVSVIIFTKIRHSSSPLNSNMSCRLLKYNIVDRNVIEV